MLLLFVALLGGLKASAIIVQGYMRLWRLLLCLISYRAIKPAVDRNAHTNARAPSLLLSFRLLYPRHIIPPLALFPPPLTKSPPRRYFPVFFYS